MNFEDAFQSKLHYDSMFLLYDFKASEKRSKHSMQNTTNSNNCPHSRKQ